MTIPKRKSEDQSNKFLMDENPYQFYIHIKPYYSQAVVRFWFGQFDKIRLHTTMTTEVLQYNGKKCVGYCLLFLNICPVF